MKETSVINHVDAGVLRIQRRHAKKFSRVYGGGEAGGATGGGAGASTGAEDAGEGYESFQEMSSDIEGLLDVVWVSGTRKFAGAYLANLHSYQNQTRPG